jgi:hypothetical protein
MKIFLDNTPHIVPDGSTASVLEQLVGADFQHVKSEALCFHREFFKEEPMQDVLQARTTSLIDSAYYYTSLKVPFSVDLNDNASCGSQTAPRGLRRARSTDSFPPTPPPPAPEPALPLERLFDLVRYMRAELHEKNLITDDEYAWLCLESPLSDYSVKRLQDYDAATARASAAEQLADELAEALDSLQVVATAVREQVGTQLKNSLAIDLNMAILKAKKLVARRAAAKAKEAT